jgi:hypothetical protein
MVDKARMATTDLLAFHGDGSDFAGENSGFLGSSPPSLTRVSSQVTAKQKDARPTPGCEAQIRRTEHG